jgi:hypothetical protein
MATRPRGVRPGNHAEQELREQEVRRANKELAAYFKGQRTEREARAALKIIKAFIRYREHLDPASRRPLSPEEPQQSTKHRKPKKIASSRIAHRRPSQRAGGEAPSDAQVRDVIGAETSPEPQPTE